MEECAPLATGMPREWRGAWRMLYASDLHGRGLHSFTFQLNVSAFIWYRGCVQGLLGGVSGVSGGSNGFKGVFLCQKRLRLS